MKYSLDFISEERLTLICKNIVETGLYAIEKSEEDFNSNIVDPFSALFDSAISRISLSEWRKREKSRQMQKTLQNAIGTFHQQVLGSIDGWEDLGIGEIVDLRSSNRKILAEIKNKWNTTKGNHKVRIYDDIKNLLKRSEYVGYTGYYVAILSKTCLDIPFTPSDNEKKCKRPENTSIREIDGASFYALATGDKYALKKLYNILPYILTNILDNKDILEYKKDPIFDDLAKNSIELMLKEK